MDRTPDHDRPASPWSLGARAAASAFLAYHLVALLFGPLSMSAPPPILAVLVEPALRWYIDALYLEHGYQFFAPEPGPSHLVRYELELRDGTRREGLFPNLAEHRPRLAYHRHFMLSEFVAFMPGDVGAENALPPDQVLLRQPLSPRQQAYVESFARHLLHRHDAVRVRLYLRRHDFPSPQQVADGMKLDDPSLYRERLLGEFREGPAP
jgi:hypothetical protein